MLDRQRAAYRDGTHAEWQAARKAVREARAAAPDRSRRNAIKGARRRLVRALRDNAERASLPASLDRSAALYKARGRLQQHMAKEEHARRHARDVRSLVRWNRRLHCEQLRRENLVEHAHYTAARFLLDRYDAVIKTAFVWLVGFSKQKKERKTKVLATICPRCTGAQKTRNTAMDARRRATKKGSSWLAKSMNHYKFRQRLASAAEGYRDRRDDTPQMRMVWFFHEPGTSKHCGLCGCWHGGLTLKDRTFVCPTCGVGLGRDVNGARNNLLAPATALLREAPRYANQPIIQDRDHHLYECAMCNYTIRCTIIPWE